jgi:hypothetical protein
MFIKLLDCIIDGDEILYVLKEGSEYKVKFKTGEGLLLDEKNYEVLILELFKKAEDDKFDDICKRLSGE